MPGGGSNKYLNIKRGKIMFSNNQPRPIIKPLEQPFVFDGATQNFHANHFIYGPTKKSVGDLVNHFICAQERYPHLPFVFDRMFKDGERGRLLILAIPKDDFSTIYEKAAGFWDAMSEKQYLQVGNKAYRDYYVKIALGNEPSQVMEAIVDEGIHHYINFRNGSPNPFSRNESFKSTPFKLITSFEEDSFFVTEFIKKQGNNFKPKDLFEVENLFKRMSAYEERLRNLVLSGKLSLRGAKIVLQDEIASHLLAVNPELAKRALPKSSDVLGQAIAEMPDWTANWQGRLISPIVSIKGKQINIRPFPQPLEFQTTSFDIFERAANLIQQEKTHLTPFFKSLQYPLFCDLEDPKALALVDKLGREKFWANKKTEWITNYPPNSKGKGIFAINNLSPYKPQQPMANLNFSSVPKSSLFTKIAKSSLRFAGPFIDIGIEAYYNPGGRYVRDGLFNWSSSMVGFGWLGPFAPLLEMTNAIDDDLSHKIDRISNDNDYWINDQAEQDFDTILEGMAFLIFHGFRYATRPIYDVCTDIKNHVKESLLDISNKIERSVYKSPIVPKEDPIRAPITDGGVGSVPSLLVDTLLTHHHYSPKNNNVNANNIEPSSFKLPSWEVKINKEKHYYQVSTTVPINQLPQGNPGDQHIEYRPEMAAAYAQLLFESLPKANEASGQGNDPYIASLSNPYADPKDSHNKQPEFTLLEGMQIDPSSWKIVSNGNKINIGCKNKAGHELDLGIEIARDVGVGAGAGLCIILKYTVYTQFAAPLGVIAAAALMIKIGFEYYKGYLERKDERHREHIKRHYDHTQLVALNFSNYLNDKLPELTNLFNSDRVEFNKNFAKMKTECKNSVKQINHDKRRTYAHTHQGKSFQPIINMSRQEQGIRQNEQNVSQFFANQKLLEMVKEKVNSEFGGKTAEEIGEHLKNLKPNDFTNLEKYYTYSVLRDLFIGKADFTMLEKYNFVFNPVLVNCIQLQPVVTIPPLVGGRQLYKKHKHRKDKIKKINSKMNKLTEAYNAYKALVESGLSHDDSDKRAQIDKAYKKYFDLLNSTIAYFKGIRMAKESDCPTVYDYLKDSINDMITNVQSSQDKISGKSSNDQQLPMYYVESKYDLPKNEEELRLFKISDSFFKEFKEAPVEKLIKLALELCNPEVPQTADNIAKIKAYECLVVNEVDHLMAQGDLQKIHDLLDKTDLSYSLPGQSDTKNLNSRLREVVLDIENHAIEPIEYWVKRSQEAFAVPDENPDKRNQDLYVRFGSFAISKHIVLLASLKQDQEANKFLDEFKKISSKEQYDVMSTIINGIKADDKIAFWLGELATLSPTTEKNLARLIKNSVIDSFYNDITKAVGKGDFQSAIASLEKLTNGLDPSLLAQLDTNDIKMMAGLKDLILEFKEHVNEPFRYWIDRIKASEVPSDQDTNTIKKRFDLECSREKAISILYSNLNNISDLIKNLADYKEVAPEKEKGQIDDTIAKFSRYNEIKKIGNVKFDVWLNEFETLIGQGDKTSLLYDLDYQFLHGEMFSSIYMLIGENKPEEAILQLEQVKNIEKLNPTEVKELQAKIDVLNECKTNGYEKNIKIALARLKEIKAEKAKAKQSQIQTNQITEVEGSTETQANTETQTNVEMPANTEDNDANLKKILAQEDIFITMVQAGAGNRSKEGYYGIAANILRDLLESTTGKSDEFVRKTKRRIAKLDFADNGQKYDQFTKLALDAAHCFIEGFDPSIYKDMAMYGFEGLSILQIGIPNAPTWAAQFLHEKYQCKDMHVFNKSFKKVIQQLGEDVGTSVDINGMTVYLPKLTNFTGATFWTQVFLKIASYFPANWYAPYGTRRQGEDNKYQTLTWGGRGLNFAFTGNAAWNLACEIWEKYGQAKELLNASTSLYSSTIVKGILDLALWIYHRYQDERGLAPENPQVYIAEEIPGNIINSISAASFLAGITAGWGSLPLGILSLGMLLTAYKANWSTATQRKATNLALSKIMSNMNRLYNIQMRYQYVTDANLMLFLGAPSAEKIKEEVMAGAKILLSKEGKSYYLHFIDDKDNIPVKKKLGFDPVLLKLNWPAVENKLDGSVLANQYKGMVVKIAINHIATGYLFEDYLFKQCEYYVNDSEPTKEELERIKKGNIILFTKEGKKYFIYFKNKHSDATEKCEISAENDVFKTPGLISINDSNRFYSATSLVISSIVTMYFKEARKSLKALLKKSFGGLSYDVAQPEGANRSRVTLLQSKVAKNFGLGEYLKVLKLTQAYKWKNNDKKFTIHNKYNIPAHDLWPTLLHHRFVARVKLGPSYLKTFWLDYQNNLKYIRSAPPEWLEDNWPQVENGLKEVTKSVLTQSVNLASEAKKHKKIRAYLSVLMYEYEACGNGKTLLDDLFKVMAAHNYYIIGDKVSAEYFLEEITKDQLYQYCLYLLALNKYSQAKHFILNIASDFPGWHYVRACIAYYGSNKTNIMVALKELRKETNQDVNYWRLLYNVLLQFNSFTNFIPKDLAAEDNQVWLFKQLKQCIENLLKFDLSESEKIAIFTVKKQVDSNLIICGLQSSRLEPLSALLPLEIEQQLAKISYELSIGKTSKRYVPADVSETKKDKNKVDKDSIFYVLGITRQKAIALLEEEKHPELEAVRNEEQFISYAAIDYLAHLLKKNIRIYVSNSKRELTCIYEKINHIDYSLIRILRGTENYYTRLTYLSLVELKLVESLLHYRGGNLSLAKELFDYIPTDELEQFMLDKENNHYEYHVSRMLQSVYSFTDKQLFEHVSGLLDKKHYKIAGLFLNGRDDFPGRYYLLAEIEFHSSHKKNIFNTIKLLMLETDKAAGYWTLIGRILVKFSRLIDDNANIKQVCEYDNDILIRAMIKICIDNLLSYSVWMELLENSSAVLESLKKDLRAYIWNKYTIPPTHKADEKLRALMDKAYQGLNGDPDILSLLEQCEKINLDRLSRKQEMMKLPMERKIKFDKMEDEGSIIINRSNNSNINNNLDASVGYNKPLGTEERKLLMQKLQQISFQTKFDSKYQESNEWADADEIYGTLNRIFDDSVHLIRPDLFTATTIFKEEGARECAKTLCGGFYIDDDFQPQGDIYASEESSLTKPIVMIFNTECVLAESELDTNKEGGSHWISCVILPANYHSPAGEGPLTNKVTIYCLDSLGHVQALPETFKKLLQEGGEFSFDTYEGETKTHRINGRYRDAVFIEGISLRQQINGPDCAQFAMYNVAEIVETGSHTFLNRFTAASETEKTRAPGLALRHLLGEVWRPSQRNFLPLSSVEISSVEISNDKEKEKLPQKMNPGQFQTGQTFFPPMRPVPLPTPPTCVYGRVWSTVVNK